MNSKFSLTRFDSILSVVHLGQMMYKIHFPPELLYGGSVNSEIK